MVSKEVYEYTQGFRPMAGKYVTREEAFNERISKAYEEERGEPKSKAEIIAYVKEFLKMYGFTNPVCFEEKASPFLKPYEKAKQYDRIKNEYNLFDKSHIVWMKFAVKDAKVHLGVVAAGADINFDMKIPSGKIISELGYSWEEESILICPLPNIGDKQRNDIECGIGNYLSRVGKVSILDYYSHFY
ncbi:hypothetical protein [Enterococcus thailandicus]|uniref:hypothetical protein n=1 Tax=Enterococcus thailandicus TaxID=417368 RepID=UPI0022E798E6|nr:hypothetical protein [Enterococcus thailandicus]